MAQDIEPIARIDWEAVIVDYSQKSTLQHLEQLKQLSSDFRMLLVSSPIKVKVPINSSRLLTAFVPQISHAEIFYFTGVSS
jgi:hypothetical protein